MNSSAPSLFSWIAALLFSGALVAGPVDAAPDERPAAAEKASKTKKKNKNRTESQQEKEEENDDSDETGEEKTSKKKPPRKGRTKLAGKPLEELVRENGKKLFGGGSVKLNGDRFEVTYNADGHLQSGFVGRGLMDTKHDLMKGANRKFIQYGDQKDGEKLLPGLTAIGMGKGQWSTRYPIQEGTWVSFKIRLPNLIGVQSVFKLRINARKGSGYETSFFQSIGMVSGNRVKNKVMTPIKEFRRSPTKWFPRHGEPLPVEFGIRGGQCQVFFNGKEMVSVPVKTDKGGKVVFIFNKLLFTIQDLKITGKIDPEWVEEELARADD